MLQRIEPLATVSPPPLIATVCGARSPLPQAPSQASQVKGPFLPKELADARPTLQSEYHKLILETALDAALVDIRKEKQSAKQQHSSKA